MMFRTFILTLSLSVAANVAAQPSDTALARMNAIKLDEACLYGVCTLEDRAASRREALESLSFEVREFCKQANLLYIRDIDDMTGEDIGIIEYEKNGKTWRTMAFLRKRDILAREKALAESIASRGQGLTDNVKAMLIQEENIAAVETRLKRADMASVRFGTLDYDTPQRVVDNSWLVYYTRDSGRIVDVVTPKDSSGVRRELRSGERTNTMKYWHLPIMWITID